MKLLLDSVILIDHFNNIEQATQYLIKNEKNIAISVITRAEILTGFYKARHIKLAKELLNKFYNFPITTVEADLAAELRYKYHWKLPDAIQAAIAKTHHLKLVTRNTKDFNEKKHSFIINPYSI